MADARSEYIPLPMKDLQIGIVSLFKKYNSYNRIALIDLAFNLNQIEYDQSASKERPLYWPLLGIIIFGFEIIKMDYPRSNPDPWYFLSIKVYGSDLFGEYKKLLNMSANNPLYDFNKYIFVFSLYEYLLLNPKSLDEIITGTGFTAEIFLEKIENILSRILLRKENSDEMTHLTNELVINSILKEKIHATVKWYQEVSCPDRMNDVNFMDFINTTCDEYAPNNQLDPYTIRKELYFFLMGDIDLYETHCLKKGRLYKRLQEDTNKKHSSDFSEKNCIHLAKYVENLTQQVKQGPLKNKENVLKDILSKQTRKLTLVQRLQLFVPQPAVHTTTFVGRMASYATQSIFSMGANRIAHNNLVSGTGQRAIISIATTVGLSIAGAPGAIISAGVATMMAPEIISFVCNKLMEPLGNYAGNLVLNFTDRSIETVFGADKKNVKEYNREFVLSLLKSPPNIVSDQKKFALYKIVPLTELEIDKFSLLPAKLVSDDCIKELCRIYKLNPDSYLEKRTQGKLRCGAERSVMPAYF